MADQEEPFAETPDGKSRQKPGHSKRAWSMFAISVVGVALLILLVGWLPRHKREEKIDREAKQEQHERPRVDVYVVRRAPHTSALMVPGTTLAYTEAYIYARASGYVSRRYADIGDHVRQGQVLATIDAPDLDKQVAQAQSTLLQSQSDLLQQQAQLKLNELNWNRYKVLVAKGVLSQQQGDQQEANYRVAVANVQAAENTVQANRDNLERLRVLQQYERVTAPFTGVITARNVDVGALISAQGNGLGSTPSPSSPSTTLAGAQGNNQGSSGNLTASTTPSTGGAQGGEMFGIASVNRLRILVSVPEAYSRAVRIGGRTELAFQEIPNESFEGRVTRTSQSIDQNTRTLLVEVQTANQRGRLMPGMYVVVKFVDIQAGRPLMVPGESIVVRGAQQTVALVKNNTVHFQPVLIGRDYGDQSEILNGLQEGEVIVHTINDEIENGVQIDPQYPKQQKSPTPGGEESQRGSGDTGQYGNQKLDDSSGNKSSQQGKSKSGSANAGKE
jgi:multidrug efflux pump subunit AcrA (membrane-fusion protein)